MSRLISDEALAVSTIWGEAEGEPFEGQVAVAEVIRNRMLRRFLSDGTVAGTVFRPLQFSIWNQGESRRIWAAQLDRDDPLVQSCERAWATAKAGSSVVGPGALNYLNPTGLVHLPHWAADPHDPRYLNPRLVIRTIGRHAFLRSTERLDDDGGTS